jgi:uncharacterized YigZ family protein
MNTTIKNDIIFEEVIKKSRFICQLKRVTSEEEAREFIATVKKTHYKASHNVSAFTIGKNQELQRSSDDGEPSGTAGLPMLEIFKKRQVIDVVAVVTRYFGGIKLGAGGLIRAYAGSVNHAIDAVGLVKLVKQTQLDLQMAYGIFDNVSRFLASAGIAIANTVFETEVLVTVFVDSACVTQLMTTLTNQFHGKINLSQGDVRLAEIAI